MNLDIEKIFVKISLLLGLACLFSCTTTRQEPYPQAASRFIAEKLPQLFRDEPNPPHAVRILFDETKGECHVTCISESGISKIQKTEEYSYQDGKWILRFGGLEVFDASDQ